MRFKRGRLGKLVRAQSASAALLLVGLVVGLPARGQTVGPDVISPEVWGPINNYGKSGSITGYAIGTIACNAGDQEVFWVGNTSQHPVIGQQLYRLKDGRFEQIGLSWAKHEFLATAEDYCQFGCVTPDPYTGAALGIHCSHASSADLNGKQTRLGPRGQINAYTGVFPYYFTQVPHPPPGLYDVHTGRRLQVHDADLDPTLNVGASYFAEIQYIAADESAAGNGLNSVSYRPVSVSDQGGVYNLLLTGVTVEQMPAMHAWKSADDSVQETTIQVPNEGRFILAALATDLGSGIWHYEYALYNQTSDRSGQSFLVPVPAGASVTNIGFRDVDYHSGDGDPSASGAIRGTDWPAFRNSNSLKWQTDTWDAQDRQANALRWGTVYNFRFDVNRPPTSGTVLIGLYKPGTPASIGVNTVTPQEPVGPCFTIADCEDGNPCTNDVCDAGACARTPIPGCCLVDDDCSDGLFCNGAETCGPNHACEAGTPIDCGSHWYCDEDTDSCTEIFDWGLLAFQLDHEECCLAGGETLTVRLTVANLQAPINGVQVLIKFNDDLLSLQSITKGDGAGSPWDNAVEVYNNNTNGLIRYAVVLFLSSSSADAAVATLKFTPAPGGGTGSAFIRILPAAASLLTKLTLGSTGASIIPYTGASIGTGVIGAKGDMNGDGLRNGLDIQGFVDVLLTGSPTPVELCTVDMNCDCTLTEYDLYRFVNCLQTDQCGCAAYYFNTDH